MENQRIFDGIRGLAFLIVLVVHAFGMIESSTQHLQGTGKYGVWLFFVLSSFLLTVNYVEASASKLDYVIGRVLRIVPLYWLACAVYGMAGVVVTPADAPMIALVRYGALHLWTIPVEFCFYGVLLAFWMIPNVRWRDAVFGMAAVASAVALLVFDKEPNSIGPLWYLPSFFAGYALARLWPRLPELRHGTAVCLAVLGALVALSPGFLYLVAGVTPSPYLMNWYLPLSVLWAVFIYAAAKGQGLATKALQSRPVAFLGKVSYSGYLFHWIVLVYVKHFVGTGLAAVGVGIVASVAVAAASYYLAEKPLAMARRTLIAVLPRPQPA